MIAALRKAAPASRIDVAVTRAGPRELFENLTGWVDGVAYLPYWEKGRAAFVAALLRERRRPQYDFVFLAYPAYRPEYQVLARAFRARRRFAHRYGRPSLRNLLWLNSDLVPVEQKHNVLRNMHLLAAAGIPALPPEGYLAPAHWVAPAHERAPRTVAVHVGTIKHDGLDAKRWPLEKFVLVCRSLIESGLDVTLVMGPDERPETQFVHSQVPATRIYEGTLADVARFLSTCGAVLTNDSGIGHLAAAVRAPVVSLFGPTPLEYAPFGPSAIALRPTDCPPCFEATRLDMSCKLGIDYACLKRDLPVGLVVETLTNLTLARHA